MSRYVSRNTREISSHQPVNVDTQIALWYRQLIRKALSTGGILANMCRERVEGRDTGGGTYGR